MDAQGRSDIDPADQWVLDPATGTYQLRLDGGQPPAASVPAQSEPRDGAAAVPRVPGSRTGEPEDGGAGEQDSRTAVPGSRVGARAQARNQLRGAPARSHGRRAARAHAFRTSSPDGPSGPPPSRRKAKPGMSRRKRILAWTAGTLGFVVVVTVVTGYLIYQHFNNNITTVDVGDAGSKGVTHDGPMNILIIGTDSRQGLGDKYGDAGSIGHADTTILLHISADRTNATALSIPRDIVTAIPDCPTRQKNGGIKVIPGSPKHLTYPKFNDSLGQDGRDPGCTMRTVKQLTGIPVDHFMMVNFEAVKTLSTAVGGVDVCLSRPLVDPKSHLDLAAGPHRIEGEQALEFVRTRHALRNQSDLDRIKLQQEFLSSMVRQMKAGGSLTNPKKLWTLADAATKALTVDTAIGSVNKLITLAKDLSNVDTKHITFATLPVIDNPNEKVHTTVLPDPTRAPQVLSLIKNDVSLTQAEKAAAKPDPKLTGPKATAHDTRVTVLNGSGVFGAAQDMVNWLQNDKGVNRSANGGNAPAGLVPHTVLDYAPNQADQARSLAAMMGLPASALHEGRAKAKPLQYMTLTLGEDYTRPGAPIADRTTLPKGVQTRQADNAACAG